MTLRPLLFKLHLYVGLSLGLLLVVIAASGTVLIFRTELDERANRELLFVARGGEMLPLHELEQRARSAHPAGVLGYVQLSGDPGRTVMFRFRDREEVYVHPRSGAVVGRRNKNETAFYRIERLHRYLAFSGKRAEAIGETIIGVTALGLLALVASGIYLWLPRSWRALRGSLTLRRELRGRAWGVNVHKVIGAYAAIVLVVSACTGLPLAFDWFASLYHQASFSTPAGPPPRSRAVDDTQSRIEASVAWRSVVERVGEFSSAQFFYPQNRHDAFRVHIIPKNAPHANATTTLHVDAFTGDVIGFQPYRLKSRGERMLLLARALHNGQWGGGIGYAFLLLGTLSLLGLVFSGAWIFWRRGAPKRAQPAA
jgi:vanillate O-demethylase ferredoxin subunit